MKTLPILFWCLTALISLIILRRRLPVQNIAAIAVLTGGTGAGLAWWFGDKPLPCGFDFFSSGALGDSDHAWCFPFFWIAMTLLSREVARLMSRAWLDRTNTGLRTLGFSSVMIAAFCTAAQSLTTRSGPPVFMAGVLPDGNTVLPEALHFLGWTIAALVTLVMTAPWLINKRPIDGNADLRSLMVWLLLALGVVSELLRQHRWGTVGAWLTLMMAVAACALRGAHQWKKTAPKTTAPPS